MPYVTRVRRAATGALAALLGMVAACSAPGSSQIPPPAPRSAANGLGIIDAEPTTSADDDDGAAPVPSTAPAPQALAVAGNFAIAWARPNLDAATWLAGVRPYTTPNYTALLTTVDPANVPATTVTGPPTPVSSTTAVLVVDIPTDTGTLTVTCDNMGGQWLVVTTGWKTS